MLGTYLRLQQVLFLGGGLPPKHSPTYSSPLCDQNRSSKVTLTSTLGLQGDVSPPWDGAIGGPPQQAGALSVLRPIYDTYRGRLHCKHLRKSHRPAPLLPVSIQAFIQDLLQCKYISLLCICNGLYIDMCIILQSFQ